MKPLINFFNFAQVRAVRRDTGAKIDIANAGLVEEIKKLLDSIQQNLFDVATQKRDECIQIIHTWDEFVQALNQKKMILAPWCDEKVWIVYFLYNSNNPGLMIACLPSFGFLGILLFWSLKSKPLFIIEVN